MSRKYVLLGGLVALSALLTVLFTFAVGGNSQQSQGGAGIDIRSLWPYTNFSKTSIAFEEVQSGGPRIDGIPPYYPPDYRYPDEVPTWGRQVPLYQVAYASIAETSAWLPDEQPVIAIEVNGDARAYPLILLNNHEIANTEQGGIPILVTFCPLCYTPVVYDRRVGGEAYHFGVTGLLRNSALIMWDHETQSFWQQFTGQAIIGEMTGQRLTEIPSIVVSWGEFKTAYPDGQALANPDSVNLMDDISYTGYDTNGDPVLFTGMVDNRLPSMERVLGYHGPSGIMAYPFSQLAKVGVVNSQFDQQPIVILWQAGAVSLFSSELAIGSAALYAATLPDGMPLTFEWTEGQFRDTQTGSLWDVFGQAIDGELAGMSLTQLPANLHFWFAWAAFYPTTQIWEQR